MVFLPTVVSRQNQGYGASARTTTTTQHHHPKSVEAPSAIAVALRGSLRVGHFDLLSDLASFGDCAVKHALLARASRP
jgi:hypothetical protein